MNDFQKFWPTHGETTPTKIREMPLDRLHYYHEYFSEMRLQLYGRDQKYMDAAVNRLDLLDKELARRHVDDRDRKTRQRADWAIWISIAGFVVSTALGVLGYLANRPTLSRVIASPIETPATSSPSQRASQSTTPTASGSP